MGGQGLPYALTDGIRREIKRTSVEFPEIQFSGPDSDCGRIRRHASLLLCKLKRFSTAKQYKMYCRPPGECTVRTCW